MLQRLACPCCEETLILPVLSCFCWELENCWRNGHIKKSVGDLARSMSLNIKKVWLKREEQEILVPASDILPGDRVIVHMGNVIPFDGEVSCGEGMVNQASLTGESLPVRRTEGQSVYAGTVLEEGELEIIVRAVSGATRFEKIVTMIEDSEKLKSNLESKAERSWRTVWYHIRFWGQGLSGLSHAI